MSGAPAPPSYRDDKYNKKVIILGEFIDEPLTRRIS